MAERMLIVKVKRTNQTQAELYGARHKFADLRLFDLAELAGVGIDPAALPIGEERPCKFWAVYELSEKLNKAGRPYRDVLTLEAVTSPATTTSAAVADGAILAELRAIRALLGAIAEAQGLQVPGDQEPAEGENGHDLDLAFPRYGDGTALGDNQAEVEAYQEHVKAEGHAPANVDALRAWVIAQRKGNGKH